MKNLWLKTNNNLLKTKNMTFFSKVVLGLVQMRCTGPNMLKKALDKIMEAQNLGAEIICLGELFLSPYFCQEDSKDFFRLAEKIPGPTSEILAREAKKLGVALVASLFEKTDEGNFYNTAIVVDADGSFLGKYRKVHIPDDPANYYSEMFYFKPGDLGFPVFNTRFGKIGILVCWDQWYPEAARALALKGAEIIFYPTAIGWQAKGKEELGKAEYDAWVTVQRAHAISNTVFVAAVNRTGLENHLNFWGGSFVADPLGRVLQKASHDKEETLIVPCNLKITQDVRKDWPFLTCRRPDVYS